MSKSSQQSLIMLACVAGVFNHLNHKRAFARVDLHRLCHDSSKLTVDCMKKWRQDEDDIFETAPYVATWIKELAAVEHTLSSVSVVYIASRIVADLKDRCNNESNLKLLGVIEEPIRVLEKFVDPEGANWIEMGKADPIMNRLYDIIDWKWDDKAKQKRRQKMLKRSKMMEGR